MRRIYVIGDQFGYAKWMQGQLVHSIEEADLVVLTGGEDVTPSLYGEDKHPYTSNNYDRDTYEFSQARKAIALNKKLIGICRGSQLICCLAGGKLVQHQENPSYFHEMYTIDGKEIRCNSTHHQAQYPFDMLGDKYKILAWTKNLSTYHEGGDRKEMNPPVECEIVKYPEIDALGIQGHPESMDHSDFQNYCQELLNLHMTNQL